MKKIGYTFIPILVVILFSILFKFTLNRRIDKLLAKKDLTILKHSYNNKARDTGVNLLDYFAGEDDLLLLGSSELGRQVPGNPVNMFPFNDSNYDVSIYGVAHMQDLNQAIRIGSSGKIDSESKLAIIVSLQWFNKTEGLMDEQFQSVFSDVQFYKFMNNDKISKANKEYAANRIKQLTGNSFKEEKIFADLYLSKNIINKGLYYITLPYFKLKLELADTRDNLKTYKELIGLKHKTKKNIKTIDFNEEYEKAFKEASSKVTNENPFNVEDKFYNKNLRNNKKVYKDRDKDINLMGSKEFDDYNFFFDVCDDLGVKPYVILMNANGWYYDYLGISKEERVEFYNKLQSIAEERGYSVLNLQEKEYEKYYLIDTMHLGWTGWLDVSEKLSEYFKGE